MSPATVEPADSPPDYRRLLAEPPRADDTERQFALAWASLAAQRGRAAPMLRVTVLRPFAF